MITIKDRIAITHRNLKRLERKQVAQLQKLEETRESIKRAKNELESLFEKDKTTLSVSQVFDYFCKTYGLTSEGLIYGNTLSLRRLRVIFAVCCDEVCDVKRADIAVVLDKSTSAINSYLKSVRTKDDPSIEQEIKKHAKELKEL